MNRHLSIHISKEKAWFVARCPELNVISEGRDSKRARANLREAMEL
jgi:predicted RNase H-like HicB family nuclease